MSEHDDSLQRALEENARLRSEREESVREASSAEFSGRMRFAERVYWVYALVCIAVAVPTINLFVGSYDTKALIACAVVMLVVYETTVLLKLWLHIASMKMGVLKEVKLLRFEVAQMATAVGVERPSEPAVKYEPMRGASPWERKLWIVVCVVVAMAVSTGSGHWLGLDGRGGDVEDDTLITLSADGGAKEVTEIVKPYSSFNKPKSFSFYAPIGSRLRFVDPRGREMPVEVSTEGTHNRHLVTLTDAVFSNGMMRYTRVLQRDGVAKQEDGVWSYENDIVYSGRENRYRVTVSLPAGAEVVSADPEPVLELDQDGHTALRFQAVRGKNEKFAYGVRYRLAEGSGEEAGSEEE